MGHNNTAVEQVDCPCLAPDGQVDRSCPDCDGTGTVDADAITADSFAPDEDDAGWAPTAEDGWPLMAEVA